MLYIESDTEEAPAASDLRPDGTKWTDPTKFSVEFTAGRLVGVLGALQRCSSLDEVKGNIDRLVPQECDFSRHEMESFARHVDQELVLWLGTCRKFQSSSNLHVPGNYTERIIASVCSLPGSSGLLMDARSECRHQKDGSGCYGFTSTEEALSPVAVVACVWLARHWYDITFKAVVTFGEIWYRQYLVLTKLDS